MPDRNRGADLASIFASLKYPLRRDILSLLQARAEELPDDRAMSPNMIRKTTGEPLTNTSYHVRQLADHKLIELDEDRIDGGLTPRRGAVEHYYRLTTLGVIALDVLDHAETVLDAKHDPRIAAL